MVVEQGRYVGLDLRKRSWEMAIVTWSGKCRKDERGGIWSLRSGRRFTGEGRLKLYKLLKAGDLEI
jgi:hypothetical protein